MFTIKHVGPTGAETIYQSAECTFTPTFADSNTANSGAASSQRGYVWYKDGAEIKTLEDGIVYVMNDHGATVAKYELSAPLDMYPTKAPVLAGHSGVVAPATLGRAA